MHTQLYAVNPIKALARTFFSCHAAEMLDATMLSARAYVQGGGSKDELARAAGIHRNTLIGIERPEWSPNVGTLRKLADGLARLERVA